MKPNLFSLLLLVLPATAFPRSLDVAIADIAARNVPSQAQALLLSQQRTNCGPTPCIIFDGPEQLVSTTGHWAYASPKANQIRGPCPGLNAAANHGYISRSGVTTIAETITGMAALYGMSADLAGFLAAYAVIMDGNPLDGTWSIGGPQPGSGLLSGLLGGGQGISWSHGVYEGDASIGRMDAFLNNGDAHSLNVTRFARAYATGKSDDRYTLDRFAQDFLASTNESIATNPYYFAAPFSGTLVVPAAYNFVINMMSNHSADQPNGYLDGETFKSFFAVAGDYPNFTWLKGQERIPAIWYRRPSSVPYAIANAFLDLAINFDAYPGSVRLGGNTNGVNTYHGVDLGGLTGGAYQPSDLLDLNTANAICFYAQLLQSVIPDAANLLVGELAAILQLITKWVKPITGNVNCAKIGKYNKQLLNQFPGYGYHPKGPATNYKKF